MVVHGAIMSSSSRIDCPNSSTPMQYDTLNWQRHRVNYQPSLGLYAFSEQNRRATGELMRTEYKNREADSKYENKSCRFSKTYPLGITATDQTSVHEKATLCHPSKSQRVETPPHDPLILSAVEEESLEAFTEYAKYLDSVNPICHPDMVDTIEKLIFVLDA